MTGTPGARDPVTGHADPACQPASARLKAADPPPSRSRLTPRERFADELDQLIEPLRVTEGAQRRVAEGALARRGHRQNLKDERRPLNNKHRTPTRTEDPATAQTNLGNRISSWVSAAALPKTQIEVDDVIQAICRLTKPETTGNERQRLQAWMRQLYTHRREVQDAILGVHARMSDMQTRQLVISHLAAYIEGSCARIDGQSGRTF